jgi:hypothetical protein
MFAPAINVCLPVYLCKCVCVWVGGGLWVIIVHACYICDNNVTVCGCVDVWMCECVGVGVHVDYKEEALYFWLIVFGTACCIL